MIYYRGIEINTKLMMISHAGESKRFQPRGGRERSFKMWSHLICSPGTTREELFDFLFAHDPDGGPINGLNYLNTVLCQQKPEIARLKLRITREKRGGVKFWGIVPDVV